MQRVNLSFFFSHLCSYNSVGTQNCDLHSQKLVKNNTNILQVNIYKLQKPNYINCEKKTMKDPNPQKFKAVHTSIRRHEHKAPCKPQEQQKKQPESQFLRKTTQKPAEAWRKTHKKKKKHNP